MNTLRTLREISTFTHEILHDIPKNINERPQKHPTNIPPGVGADSSCPYPCITKYAFSHYQIHIFISLHTHIRSSFCGYIRICGHDKSAPTAANGLPTTLLANWNNVANILQNIHIQLRISQRTPTKTPHEHSARRRGPIHRARILA